MHKNSILRFRLGHGLPHQVKAQRVTGRGRLAFKIISNELGEIAKNSRLGVGKWRRREGAAQA